MPATKWLTLADVKDRTTLPHSEIKRLAANGAFPPPVDQSDGTIVWRENDIDEWIASRPRVEDIPWSRTKSQRR